MAGRHKNDTAEFGELTFAEQAKSISATIMNLEAAIDHHIKSTGNKEKTRVTSVKLKSKVCLIVCEQNILETKKRSFKLIQ